MFAADVADRVSNLQGGIATSLREVALVAEGKAGLVRNGERGYEPLVGAKQCTQSQAVRIGSVLRRKQNVDSVCSNAGFIHGVGVEYVSFTQCEHLPVPFTSIAKAGDVGTLRWLSTKIALVHVVAMEGIFVADIVVNVDRSLVNVDRCSG